MYNIRIKSVPNKAKTGSQLDYSLVDRNTLFLKPNTPVDSDVKNTMGAVPREHANIEAEGGETVVGDINGDGFLEHQTIVGKRHTQGGVPLNVPEGSFIFSDTKKMIIKDPEILAMFGMKPSKKGYTPAEIAKKYNINDYIAIVKDPAKDKYSKETAQIMLDSNLKKLGMLALVQESMKGFPDGVPAIAESVMGQMMGGQGQESPEQESQEGPEEQGPQEEMQEGEQPQQRYGGTQLPKAQVGKNLNNPFASSNSTPIPSWASVNQVYNSPKKIVKKTKATVPQKPFKNDDNYTGYWDRAFDQFGRVLGTGNPNGEEITWTSKNDPRMEIAAEKLNPFSSHYNGEGFLGGAMDYLGNLASMPQKEMNHIMTGLYETPMTTVSRYHKLNYGTRLVGDIVSDPLIMDFAIKAAAKKAIPYGANAARYVADASVEGAKYLGKKLAPLIGNIAKKIEPAIKYTKEVWDKIPIDKKVLILEKISQGSTHFESANSKPLTTKELEDLQNHMEVEHKLASKEEKTPEPQQSVENTLPAETTLTQNDNQSVMIGNPVSQTVKYYNPKLSKPEDTNEVKWLPAQNSAELKGAINSKSPSIVDDSQKVVLPNRTSKQEVKDMSPVIFDTSGETDRGYKYGGLYHMQVGGGTPKFDTATGMYQNYDANGKPINAPYKSGITYDVKDKDLLEKAKDAGYNIIGNNHAPNITYIGPQTSKTGFKINPESGIYENPKFPIGKEGLDELVNNWKDELSNYEGPSGKGIDAWKKDLLNQKGQAGPASTYYALEANKNSSAAGFGNQIDTNIEDWNKPGQEWYSTKKFIKKPVQVANTQDKKEDVIPAPVYPPSIANNREGWSREASLNYLNAFGPRIYRGAPLMQKFNAYAPDYILPDPAQAIAHVLSGVAGINNTADNTMAGNVGFGAKLGAMGQGLDQTTKIQSDYDNAGVGIYNQAQVQGAQAYDNNNQLNEKSNYQYNNDRQVLDQNWANSFNKRRSNILKATILGDIEEGKMHAIKTWFPQVGIDNWNKHIGWSGVGRDWRKYDNYINPAGSGIGTGKSSNGIEPDYSAIHSLANNEYAKAYKEVLTTMGEDDAKAYAKQVALNILKQKTNSNAPGYGTNTASGVYSAMFGNNPYDDQDNNS